MIPEVIASFLGKSGDTIVFEVERGAIKRFADSVGDYNPLYWDDEFARQSGYGAIIAPPGFFGWPTKWTGMPVFVPIQVELQAAMAKAGFGRLLAGGIEYDFLRPVRSGDTLAALPKVISIVEKESKGGAMFIATIETTYTNQEGFVAAKARNSMIAR